MIMRPLNYRHRRLLRYLERNPALQPVPEADLDRVVGSYARNTIVSLELRGYLARGRDGRLCLTAEGERAIRELEPAE